MNQIKIGKFIAERRKERGFLQKDIAARLGISEKIVSKWECGNGLPEIIYMEPLCQILGITVNELLGGETIPIMELMSHIDRSRLKLVKQLEFEQLKMRLYKLYDIEIETMETSENGAGGLTYFVKADGKRFRLMRMEGDLPYNIFMRGSHMAIMRLRFICKRNLHSF